MIDYTVTALIADIKRRGSLPTVQSLFSTDDFIAFLDDAMKMVLIPSIMKTKEEFFVHTTTQSIVSGQSAYPISSRAIGARTRQIYIRSNGDDNERIVLPRLSPTNISTLRTYGTYAGYYFKNNNIIVYPTPTSSSDTLCIEIYRRPGKLTAASNCAQITAIDTGTGVITFSAVPSGITSTADFISNEPPFISREDSVALSSVTATTVTVSTETAALLSVGDYMCPPGTSCIPQIAYELFPMLTQYALMKLFDSLGDEQGAASAAKDLELLRDSLFTMLDSRDDGSPKKVNSRRNIWNT